MYRPQACVIRCFEGLYWSYYSTPAIGSLWVALC